MAENEILGSKEIEQLRDAIAHILKTSSMDKEELVYKEKELQDLLHEIEFADSCDGNYFEDFIVRLQQHRRERRKLKDELFIIEPVAELLREKYPNLINDLNKALGRCRKGEETIQNRTYTPRTNIFKQLLEDDVKKEA
ncbi:hypothetical protein [Dehalobacter sp. TeCB1]|uniref:hypothetical protein n=1 Tax=Dehalobacter sp. TeCB1 TaxID=1843715 RepID=UPI00083AA560|nr:hypothetical protein [Dehalobacter sp. TeCB1]OCZ53817.1 hypothetical protein A7D23_07600 [Dehalobacter sp. TeCB1]